MTTDPMPEPEGPEDERFVYVVTAAGVEVLLATAAEFDSERVALEATDAITLATASGRLIARQMAGEELPEALEACNPGRFG